MAVIATIEGLGSITSLFTPPFFVEQPAVISREPSPAAKVEAVAKQAAKEAKIASRRARELHAIVRVLDRRAATPTVVAARRNAAVEAIAQAKRAIAAAMAARTARTAARLEKVRASEEARTRRPAVGIRQALERIAAHRKRVQAVHVAQAVHAAATSEAARMRRAEARLVAIRHELTTARAARRMALLDEMRQVQAAAESARATAQRFASQMKAKPPSLPADPREALAPYVDRAVSEARAAAGKIDSALTAGADVAGKVLAAAHAESGGDTPLISPTPTGGTTGGAVKIIVPVAAGAVLLWFLL